LTADPGQLGAWINQVALLRSLDRTETALACARHAVNLHPGDALAWGALSGALLDQHKPAEAMEAVERGLALAAEHPGLLAQQRAVQQTLDR
jgi:predicted Zn-dependent protease